MLNIVTALNILCGLTGAVWLLITGDWKLVLLFSFMIILAPLIYPIILTPPLGLVTLIGKCFKEGNKIMDFLCGLIIVTVIYLMNLLFVVLIFLCAYSNETKTIPYLLFGDGIITIIFALMAADPDSIVSYSSLYFVEISYIILAVLLLFKQTGLALPVILPVLLFFIIHTMFTGTNTDRTAI